MHLPSLTGFTEPKVRSVFFKTTLNLILINFKTNDFPFYKHQNSDSSSSRGSGLQGLEKTRTSLVRTSTTQSEDPAAIPAESSGSHQKGQKEQK